jgi:hypothetical protein
MGKPSGSTIIAKSQSLSEEIAKAFAAGVVRKSCPLCAQKRTSIDCSRMSARCQKRTSPAHSITLSARARSDGGKVSPSAFAVLRLMMSSNSTGCWTGRQPRCKGCGRIMPAFYGQRPVVRGLLDLSLLRSRWVQSEVADPRPSRCVLRARYAWQQGCSCGAAHKCDEFPSPHGPCS